MYKIIVSDPLEATGLAMLRDSGHEVIEVPAEEHDKLPELLADADALVVRSGTRVTAELLAAGRRLKVVGRAGIGVDNIDIDAATGHGILVVNAPTANLLSATEHTFALMLAVARNVSAADADIKSRQWNRKKWVGAELQGKTLGVIGFGRIGQQVARRARAFDMRSRAYDPLLDHDLIRRENAEPMGLDEMLPLADVVTLHVPMTDATRNILNAGRVGRMKPGAILINCARGGVVDEEAVLAALESGRMKGAGLDVFAEEPPTDYALAAHPRVVATPHLGAQTREAQVRISTETAKMVIAALDGSLAVTAVNLPFRPAGVAGEPYLRLAEKLGRLASVLGPDSFRRISIELSGIDADLRKPIAVAAVKGALSRSLGETVNYVNAERIAADRGLEVVRSTRSDRSGFPNLMEIEVQGESGSLEVAGTIFHERDERIVKLERYVLEFVPKGNLLIVRNDDVPGVVGKLGTILGDAGVNIAAIHLSRVSGRHEALAVVRLDEAPSEAAFTELRGLPEVKSVHWADVGAV